LPPGQKKMEMRARLAEELEIREEVTASSGDHLVRRRVRWRRGREERALETLRAVAELNNDGAATRGRIFRLRTKEVGAGKYETSFYIVSPDVCVHSVWAVETGLSMLRRPRDEEPYIAFAVHVPTEERREVDEYMAAVPRLLERANPTGREIYGLRVEHSVPRREEDPTKVRLRFWVPLRSYQAAWRRNVEEVLPARSALGPEMIRSVLRRSGKASKQLAGFEARWQPEEHKGRSDVARTDGAYELYRAQSVQRLLGHVCEREAPVVGMRARHVYHTGVAAVVVYRRENTPGEKRRKKSRNA
jgi:hypothetical protein